MEANGPKSEALEMIDYFVLVQVLTFFLFGFAVGYYFGTREQEQCYLQQQQMCQTPMVCVVREGLREGFDQIGCANETFVYQGPESETGPVTSTEK